MLGIAFIVLLVYFLFCYRPQKLDRESAFKEALRWSEWGKECFISQIIFLIGLSFVPLIFCVVLRGQLSQWMQFNDIFLFPFDWLKESINIPINLIFYVPPLFFAWLAHTKLVKPLRDEKIPSRKWSLFLSIMGLFFGLAIGLLVMGLADERIKDLT